MVAYSEHGQNWARNRNKSIIMPVIRAASRTRGFGIDTSVAARTSSSSGRASMRTRSVRDGRSHAVVLDATSRFIRGHRVATYARALADTMGSARAGLVRMSPYSPHRKGSARAARALRRDVALHQKAARRDIRSRARRLHELRSCRPRTRALLARSGCASCDAAPRKQAASRRKEGRNTALFSRKKRPKFDAAKTRKRVNFGPESKKFKTIV